MSLRHVPEISELVGEFKSKRLLAYGCGEGHDYRRERVHVVWGVDQPILYDAKHYPEKPVVKFDGVICIGALDHMRADDLLKAVTEIAGYARQWAYIGVSDRSVKAFDWWSEFLPLHFRGGARLVLRRAK